MSATVRFVNDDFSFIAGPATLTEPIDSQDVHEIAEYPTEEVLAALLALPNVRQICGTGARWSDWTAAWECGDRLILFEDVEEFHDEGHFCGLSLRCDCRVGDVLGCWEALRARYSGLWLIDTQSCLLTPPAFLAGYTFDPSWRTSDVLALARGVRTEGAFDRLPILADALQDAGCNSADILDHCRDVLLTHARGCWVVDLVLGKS